MRQYLRNILFLGFLISQAACTNHRLFFRNKILVYSSVPQNDSTKRTHNATFIDYFRDTINWIGYPFNLFEEQEERSGIREEPNIFPWSNVPFRFVRDKNSIYIKYVMKGGNLVRKYFTIDDAITVETVTFDFLCNGQVGNR